MSKSKGFTLAEILIALTVIGVVSSLTIPSLINNIGDQKNLIAWKKTFADFSQVTNKLLFDNGGSFLGLFTNQNVLRDKYLQYLNYTKSCINGQSPGNCWHNNGNVRDSNGSIISRDGDWFNYHDGSPGVILANGTLVLFSGTSSNCTTAGLPVCGLIYLDINGFNGPNQHCKDIFAMQIRDTGIKPNGFEVAFDNASGSGCSVDKLIQ